MAALIWGAWGEQWALEEKVSFNGTTKTITVHDGVTSLSIRDDVYNAWVRYTEREPWALPAMRFSGADPIPGGETGVTFFTINGWKLFYDPRVVSVSGVLYSEDYDTPFWYLDGSPIYPATVAALVNSTVSVQNVITGTALTAEETAAAVWQAAARTLTASMDPNASQIAAAVLAEILASVIPANVVQMNNATVTGTGVSGDKWRGV
jgi:hypothetical protein